MDIAQLFGGLATIISTFLAVIAGILIRNHNKYNKLVTGMTEKRLEKLEIAVGNAEDQRNQINDRLTRLEQSQDQQSKNLAELTKEIRHNQSQFWNKFQELVDGMNEIKVMMGKEYLTKTEYDRLGR